VFGSVVDVEAKGLPKTSSSRGTNATSQALVDTAQPIAKIALCEALLLQTKYRGQGNDPGNTTA
jgi:hypothetical protein